MNNCIIGGICSAVSIVITLSVVVIAIIKDEKRYKENGFYE